MRQRTEYDPSFVTEGDKAEAKAVADARRAEQEGYAEDERAGLVPGQQGAPSAGNDVDAKDAERAGRAPGEHHDAGVWDADVTGHTGRSGISELERRAGGQEIGPDDIDDEGDEDAPHGGSSSAPSDFSDGTERQKSPDQDLAEPTGEPGQTPGRGQQGDYGAKGGKIEGEPVDWKGDSYEQMADQPPSQQKDDDDLGPTPHSGN